MADHYDLPQQFLDGYAPESWFRVEHDGHFSIDPLRVEELTNYFQYFIADVVAMILDAGSERDAVNENEDLHRAIRDELLGWVPD